MKWFSILLLSCLPLLAQHPLITGSGVGWTKPPASSVPDPTTIPGLAYYWNSSDLPSSGSVSNWTDRIQGMQWTNGNSSQYATGGALGVIFNGTTSKLTNKVDLSIGPINFWTAFIIVKVIRTSNPFDGFFTDLPGNTSNGFDFGVGTVEVPVSGTALWAQPNSVFQDWIVPVRVLGAGSPKAYTNNIAAKTLASQIFGTPVGLALATTQGGGAPGNFQISVMALYTNNLIDVSTNPIYRTALHLWATNASPSAPFAP